MIAPAPERVCHRPACDDLTTIVPIVNQAAGWQATVQAVATAIGGLGTAGALLFVAQTYRREQNDVRRRHASKISVWMEESVRGRSYGGFPYGLLSNTSDEPAYDCAVSFYAGERLLEVSDIVDTLPPKERLHIATRTVEWTPDLILYPAVTFTDRNGRRWVRDRNGVLSVAKTDG
jgi:hypothetical protein